MESDDEWGDAGFLHVVNDPVPPVAATRKSSVPYAVVRYKVEKWAKIRPLRILNLSMKLGVSVPSLRRLHAGWNEDKRCYTFPMSDDLGRYVGVRFRSLDGKGKWSLRGGRNGLFVPLGLTRMGSCLLVEGPTDCAAALDLGYDAIGRPDNCGGANYLNSILRNFHNQRLVIVADNDDAGWYGARRLARKLDKGVSIIAPRTANDIRDYYNTSGCRNALSRAIRGQDNKHWIVEQTN